MDARAPDPLALGALEGVLPAGWTATPEARDAPPEWRFLVIPGPDGPRWIVPESPALGWPALACWRPFGRASRAKWAAAAAAYRAGQLRRLPGVARIGAAPPAGDARDGWAALGWDEAAPPAPVVSIGVPGPTRKASAILVSRARRRPRAVVKAPLAAAARARIAHEAAALRRLARTRPGLAPRLLYEDRESGRSAQTAAPARMPQARIGRAHRDWLARLVPKETRAPLAEVCARIAARLDAAACLAPARKARCAAALDALARSGAGEVGLGESHGDFAPWNLRAGADGALVAFDWEFAEPAAPRGDDIAHFLARVALAQGLRDPRALEARIVAALARPALAPLLGHGNPRLIWRLYALGYIARVGACGIADGCAEILNQVVETWRHEPL